MLEPNVHLWIELQLFKWATGMEGVQFCAGIGVISATEHRSKRFLSLDSKQ
jgi:hypothetical protein